ncbi:hypothetical protein AMTR_s00073p00193380 [Amborella trichopoda]|uniref:Uncharacterized protein n=1 Tax=Amborella trichopoda TaxID=13333 RepID=W1NNQ0_AMBTC|nr:hypothetical protein AMTR_s00073p00193380 [Amborella trichopoda]
MEMRELSVVEQQDGGSLWLLVSGIGIRKRDGREWEETGSSQLPSGAIEAGKKGSLVAGVDGEVVRWWMEASWAAAEWGGDG